MNILTVDDSSLMRKIVRGSVETLGFGCLEAGDGDEALALLNDEWQTVSLIVLDWNMPNKNGYETLLALKQQANTRDIPVMMLTTEVERQRMILCIQAGAKNYLTKPFNQQDLLTRMAACMGLC